MNDKHYKFCMNLLKNNPAKYFATRLQMKIEDARKEKQKGNISEFDSCMENIFQFAHDHSLKLSKNMLVGLI